MPSATSSVLRLELAESVAKDLVGRFGTPLYVLDEQIFRERIRRYRRAMASSWPRSELSLASKANSTLALLSIAAEEGCLIDAASEGELRAALLAGVPASRCHLHGNNKSVSELEFAVEAGVHQIVIDHFSEIDHLAEIHSRAQSASFPELILRLAPGVDPQTHHKISTGQADTKFGFNIADGSAERALLKCTEAGLPVRGFHCHVGSQLFDPEAQEVGGETLAEFAVAMLQRHGFRTELINVGGGLGVHYTDSDPEPMPVEEYCRLVAASVRRGLGDSGLDVLLTQEPGRSLVAEAGATLYQVGVVKTVPSSSVGQRTYVVVDGGLSDNPRPALYGARYTVRLISKDPGAARNPVQVTVAGKHCETDNLFENVTLPATPMEGDIIHVSCTGAYNSSMASNYNRYPRPATVLIRSNGEYAIVQRRETWDEMFARELGADGSQF